MVIAVTSPAVFSTRPVDEGGGGPLAVPGRGAPSAPVTSSVPEEGKTTTVIYLGTTMAQSGQRVLLVDTVQGKLLDDEAIKMRYASRRPYGEWLDRNLDLDRFELPFAGRPPTAGFERIRVVGPLASPLSELIASIATCICS